MYRSRSEDITRSKFPLALNGLNHRLLDVVDEDGRCVVRWAVVVLVYACADKRRRPAEIDSPFDVALGIVAHHPDGRTDALGCFGSG